MFDIRKALNVSAAFSSGILIVLNYLMNGSIMAFLFLSLGMDLKREVALKFSLFPIILERVV